MEVVSGFVGLIGVEGRGWDEMGWEEGWVAYYRLEVRCWECDDVCGCVCICVEKGGNRGREGKRREGDGRKENREGRREEEGRQEKRRQESLHVCIRKGV